MLMNLKLNLTRQVNNTQISDQRRRFIENVLLIIILRTFKQMTKVYQFGTDYLELQITIPQQTRQ